MAGQIINRGKNVWLVRVFLGRGADGKRQYDNQTVKGTKKAAQDYLSTALHKQSTGEFGAGRTTVMSDLFDDLLLDYKTNGKDHDWAERVVRVHLRPTFDALLAVKVGTTRIRQYIDERQQAGDANATINRALSLLKRAFNLGRKCTPPKVAIVPHIPMLQEKNVRKGFFEHEDYLKLRDALPADIRPILTFAYYTGCRRGEILSLEWRQVDLAEQVLRLDPGTTKNEEARVIPIDGELFETLAMQRTRHDAQFPESPWVFSRGGTRVANFQKAWSDACKAAGLWDAKRKRPTKLLHDLRRSGVRNLVRAGVPEKTAMAISGHKTRSVFDRYNIVDEADLKTAARRVTKYLSEKTKAAEEKWHTIGTQADEEAEKTSSKNPRKLLN